MEPDLDDTGMQWPPGVAKHKRVRLEIHDSLRFDDDRSSAVTDMQPVAHMRLLKEVSLVRMHEVFFCGRVTKATGNKMSCHTCIILELSAAYKITLFK